MKPWIANLIFIIIEIAMIGAGFAIAAEAIEYLVDGDISGYFSTMTDLINYVSILDVIILVVSLLFLIIKPLRTKFTGFWSVCNIIWVVLQMALLYLNN